MCQKRKTNKIILKTTSCGSCDNITMRDEPICDVYNTSVDMYRISMLKYGCQSYEVDNMIRFELEKEIEGQMYILYERTRGKQSADFSAEVVKMRMPNSEPRIIDGGDMCAVYVLKEMS
jgi:hypothetical protein